MRQPHRSYQRDDRNEEADHAEQHAALEEQMTASPRISVTAAAVPEIDAGSSSPNGRVPSTTSPANAAEKTTASKDDGPAAPSRRPPAEPRARTHPSSDPRRCQTRSRQSATREPRVAPRRPGTRRASSGRCPTRGGACAPRPRSPRRLATTTRSESAARSSIARKDTMNATSTTVPPPARDATAHRADRR